MITIAPELRELPHYQLADLLELQGELKDLTERNAGKLRRSIAKHGLFVPFFVWPAPDGNTYILDGHQRKRTLVKDGHGSLLVPCVLVHADTLPEAKEKLLVISSQYGRITQEGFDEFTFDLPDVGEMVNFDALAFEFEQDEEPAGTGYAEPQTDRAAELQEKWQTERGQLWAIGEHRLLCGDSTVRADVERVMGGERADTVCTDPPYNVDKAVWDTDILPILSRAADVIPSILADDGICFWFCATRYIPETIAAASLLTYKWMFIWYPSNNMAHGDLGFQKFTAALVLSKGAKIWRENMQDLREFPIRITSQDPGHPTPKPIELISYLVEMASRSIVFDGFAGSGTTLVACQNLNRRGRAIEISPAYCAVILQRMADAFPGIEIHQLP